MSHFELLLLILYQKIDKSNLKGILPSRSQLDFSVTIFLPRIYTFTFTSIHLHLVVMQSPSKGSIYMHNNNYINGTAILVNNTFTRQMEINKPTLFYIYYVYSLHILQTQHITLYILCDTGQGKEIQKMAFVLRVPSRFISGRDYEALERILRI